MELIRRSRRMLPVGLRRILGLALVSDYCIRRRLGFLLILHSVQSGFSRQTGLLSVSCV